MINHDDDASDDDDDDDDDDASDYDEEIDIAIDTTCNTDIHDLDDP